jgi:hypothetical protein
LIKGKLTHYFCGRGFYAFIFEVEEDKDLIFRNDPYFFSTRGMYLNCWTPNFNPKHNVPLAISVWVHLLHLPLQCQNEDTMHSIKDSLGRYIHKSKLRDGMFACTRLCVEVDLEMGLLEATVLTLDN